MGLENFEISLENPTEIYYIGQTVTGTLKFKLTKEKRMRGVELTFLGEAHVNWSEQVNMSDQWSGHTGGRIVRNRRHYDNRETYLNQTVYLVGSPNDEMTLQPGEYSYPFAYLLPTSVPSSFEGEHGHVRYVIKGVINRPWRFDHKCKRVFTVICPLDLNAEADIQQPHQQSAEKVGGCLCRSNPITVVVNTPIRGFVPGQEIKATIEVDNQTGNNASMKCSLIQKVTYMASCGKRKEWQRIVTKQILREVFQRGSLTEFTALRIPAVPASKLVYCRCIDIAYVFQVKAVLSTLCGDVIVRVPIAIGNIPLVTQFEYIKSPDMFDPSAPMEPQYPLATPHYSQYPDMPPPSYGECISGKTNVRSEEDDSYVQGNFDFAPRYPFFFFK